MACCVRPVTNDSWRYAWTSSPAVLSYMVERPAELMPGAMDVGLDGTERQVEGGRDLLIGSAFDVPQHDAGSVLGPEAGDGPLDRGAHLARLELIQRGFLVHHDIERRGFDGVGCLGVRRPVHADGVELPSSQMIDR